MPKNSFLHDSKISLCFNITNTIGISECRMWSIMMAGTFCS